MTTKTALFALLAMWGVSACIDLPAFAEDQIATEDQANDDDDSAPLKRSFTNRVWVREDDTGLPSVIRIFLSDGTLVQDSCWETHRLSAWKMTGDNAVTWNEDGADIAAEIVSVSADSLTLSLKLGNEAVQEHYKTATVPYVCPDIPKA